MKKEFVIRKGDGTVLKSEGKLLLFGTHDEAVSYVNITYNNSPHFTVERWRGVKDEPYGN